MVLVLEKRVDAVHKALVKLCGSGCTPNNSLANASITAKVPDPITAEGKDSLPPEQLLRSRNRIVGAVVVEGVFGLLEELFVPVDPPSGKAGLGIPLRRNLNLKCPL